MNRKNNIVISRIFEIFFTTLQTTQHEEKLIWRFYFHIHDVMNEPYVEENECIHKNTWILFANRIILATFASE